MWEGAAGIDIRLRLSGIFDPSVGDLDGRTPACTLSRSNLLRNNHSSQPQRKICAVKSMESECSRRVIYVNQEASVICAAKVQFSLWLVS